MPEQSVSRTSGVAWAVRRYLPIEIVALILLAIGYNWVRGSATPDPAAAFGHARDLVRLEGVIHTGFEIPFNQWMTSTAWLAIPACYFYAVFHYAATPAVLIWARIKHRGRYPVLWWTIVLASAGALVLYATYPVAPPRLLPGSAAIDTLAAFDGWGWWGGHASVPRGLGAVTNQFAALPSMHFGWALWCGIAMQASGMILVRFLGVLYPAALGLVVIGTGNHFLVDVLLGGLFVLVAYVVCRRIQTRFQATREVKVPAQRSLESVQS